MPAELDSYFLATANQLATASAEVYFQHKQGYGGTWSIPPVNISSWNGDLFDFTLMGDVFSRDDLAAQYSDAINRAIVDDANLDEPSQLRGTAADIAGVKLQSGYLEQREQAFRARHTTPIMATCYAAARRKGHGAADSEAVGIFGVMVDHVFNVLNHGR